MKKILKSISKAILGTMTEQAIFIEWRATLTTVAGDKHFCEFRWHRHTPGESESLGQKNILYHAVDTGYWTDIYGVSINDHAVVSVDWEIISQTSGLIPYKEYNFQRFYTEEEMLEVLTKGQKLFEKWGS